MPLQVKRANCELAELMKTLCCTIVTQDYLPAARALFESVREHNDVDCIGLVVDGPVSEPDFVGTSFLVEAGVITDLMLQQLAFRYRAMEFCCALRPVLLQALLATRPVEQIAYLDSDMLVLSSLSEVLQEARSCSLLLYHHTRSSQGLHSGVESALYHCGPYNSGFLVLSRCQETATLLEWWKQRLANRGYLGFYNQFVDQKWLTLAPSFFPGVRTASSPGVNIAYWNFHEGELGEGANGFTFADKPLRLFHFSGWEPGKPERVSKFWNGPTPQAWHRLSQLYLQRLQAAGLGRKFPYAYERYPSGTPITNLVRRFYGEELDAGRIDASRSPFLMEKEIQRRAPENRPLLAKVLSRLASGLERLARILEEMQKRSR